MTCVTCDSDRLVSISSNVDDVKGSLGNIDFTDYIPPDIGIGDGDELSFSYCLECGQIQEDFPMSLTRLEEENEQF